MRTLFPRIADVHTGAFLSAGIFSLVFAMFFTVSSPHALAFECHTLHAHRQIPSGFGASFNLFSASNELLVKMTCSESLTLSVGNGTANTLIYSKGYEYRGGRWQQFSLSSSRSVGNWYTGSAQAIFPKKENTGFVAVYVCQKPQGSNVWKCGCRTENCSQSYWQLQGFSWSSANANASNRTTTTTKNTQPTENKTSQQTTSTQNTTNTGATRASSPPPKGGFSDIERLSPRATLPSVATCQARVHKSSWEPKEQNNDENYNTTDLRVTSIGSIHSDKVDFYLDRIEAVNRANITGTTDELIQFFSCYWGLDDNETRARAYIESAWDQDTNGDYDCGGKGVSWGLMQVKNQTPRGCEPTVHTYTYPDVFVSTANNLNFALAWSAACYRGDMNHWVPDEFFDDTEKRIHRCYGLWFSGNWWGGWEEYVGRFEREMREAHWLSQEFDSWHDNNLCRDRSCDTLPSD